MKNKIKNIIINYLKNHTDKKFKELIKEERYINSDYVFVKVNGRYGIKCKNDNKFVKLNNLNHVIYIPYKMQYCFSNLKTVIKKFNILCPLIESINDEKYENNDYVIVKVNGRYGIKCKKIIAITNYIDLDDLYFSSSYNPNKLSVNFSNKKTVIKKFKTLCPNIEIINE